ncbi:4-fold beta flower protein [Chryseobacterium sp. VD8]|uniref:4-fold beta flower protein n=1 Tax=Chryseobacterium sp. VD8 TaxID=3081254 RepID=UPI003FA54F96
MTPIYDRHGRTIAWINNNFIYHLSGRQVLAFINNNSVFTYGSRHLGRFSNGFFRDRNGNAIAFIQGATNGPIPPIPQIPPIPPIPAIPPIPPIPPIDSLSWSNLTWENFINV